MNKRKVFVAEDGESRELENYVLIETTLDENAMAVECHVSTNFRGGVPVHLAAITSLYMGLLQDTREDMSKGDVEPFLLRMIAGLPLTLMKEATEAFGDTACEGCGECKEEGCCDKH